MNFVFSILILIMATSTSASINPAALEKYNISTSVISTKKFYNKKEAREFSHAFDVTLVRLRGTKWTNKKIKKRMSKVIDTFKLCNIKVEKLELVSMDAPFGFIDIGEGNRANKILAELEGINKPSIFYIRWDLESKNPAWAHRELLNSGEAKVNTAWMTFFSSVLEYPDLAYSIEAHELGHILLNEGHDFSEDKNLMSYEGLLNAKILTEDQCAKIKTSELVRKITQ